MAGLAAALGKADDLEVLPLGGNAGDFQDIIDDDDDGDDDNNDDDDDEDGDDAEKVDIDVDADVVLLPDQDLVDPDGARRTETLLPRTHQRQTRNREYKGRLRSRHQQQSHSHRRRKAQQQQEELRRRLLQLRTRSLSSDQLGPQGWCEFVPFFVWDADVSRHLKGVDTGDCADALKMYKRSV